MTRAPNTHSLLADIGGTNTRVALAQGTTLLPDTIRRFRNKDFPGLESVLRRYLDEEGNPDCAGVCVAVAGPVRDGVAEMTNLSWIITKDALARAAQAETVAILNDLQAQGHALGHLSGDSLRPVVRGGDPTPHAAMLVIGVGTGFNCAPVYQTGAGRLVPPSEAGHANMPIRTADELALLHFVETAHGFPAVEDVLSGRGLERIHLWLSTRAGDPVEKGAAEIMAAAEAEDPLALETLRFFVRILGTVTGNLSLIHLPFGGVFLVGGVARAVAPWLERFDFAHGMSDKGRFAGFMQNFPVTVIEDDYAALTGCGHHLAHILPG
ncbi:glucokinase [Aliiroseovarius subalbicans]|uniref:glucokinase n=1 Tax=Aliiroseovarius subalbicans TaxID=2925840 RepID=UPI001F57EBB3|nr:glucokinase [Aliiroseovarius subalbicans]MCI2398509.1 glucokinase [Aliiroseovarius subalbicans]